MASGNLPYTMDSNLNLDKLKQNSFGQVFDRGMLRRNLIINLGGIIYSSTCEVMAVVFVGAMLK